MSSCNNKTICALTIIACLAIGFLAGKYLPNHNTSNTMIMQHDMSSMMMDMNANLRGKTGDDLDKAFLEEMIIHHEGAVEMAQILLDGSQRPELTQLANEIINAQTQEIEMMQQWQTEWFSN